MNYQIEISRNNVTLSAFLSYVKAACKKKGIDCYIDRDEFENPTRNEDSRYFVKDGKKINCYNGYRTEWPAEDAPCQSEIYRVRPLDTQIYMLNFDGSCYNEICEFTYDDEKRGSGYYYQVNKDAE